MTARRTRHVCAGSLAVTLTFAMLATGCGGEAAAPGPSVILEDAVAKTQAAQTARMTVDISITDGQSTSFDFAAEALVDFQHERDLTTTEVAGQTVQVFSDGSGEYIRRGTSGRFERQPASAQASVANNPADSLRYLGTDVIDVERADETGCYEGKLDFDRVFDRVESGREGEFPAELRGQLAPVLVCLDTAGRIRRYDVELLIEGAEVKTAGTLFDHGRAPTLEPLGPGGRLR